MITMKSDGVILYLTVLVWINEISADCPQIVSRKDWGGRSAVVVEYAIIPVQNVIIHHTVTPQCNTFESCCSTIRSIQNFHQDDLEFHDIGYNFLIGGDGQVYEGAGWHKVGAHTRGYNSRSIGLTFIGDFTTSRPSRAMIKAGKDFLKCAVEMGELSKDYKLFGAKQVSVTASPGLFLYKEIQKWPNYSSTP